MSKYCPIIKSNVTYLYCEDCEKQVCRYKKGGDKMETKTRGKLEVTIANRTYTSETTLQALQKESSVFKNLLNKQKTRDSFSILNGFFYYGDERYEGYAEMYFSKNGRLVSIDYLWDEARQGVLWFPRKVIQDVRYNNHLVLLKKLLGDPDEETDTFVRYNYDDGYIECKQILSGPETFQGAWIEIHFTKEEA